MTITLNKKAEESLVTTKLISMILLILVILALLLFLMKPEILDWIKAVPGYESSNNTEIDLSQMPADQMANYGCIDRVAVVGTTPLGKFFGRDLRDFFIIAQGKNVAVKTNLSIDTSNSIDLILKYRTFIFKRDIVVGHIINDVLTVQPELVKGYASSEIAGKISLANLKRIDNSTLYRSTTNPYLLCKTR